MARRARRRRATAPPRCKTCNARIVFHRTWSGQWLTFEPREVDGRTHSTGGAMPVVYGHAWQFRELVEELLVRHQYGRSDAEDEAYDVPWYVLHTCPLTTTTTEQGEDPQ